MHVTLKLKYVLNVGSSVRHSENVLCSSRVREGNRMVVSVLFNLLSLDSDECSSVQGLSPKGHPVSCIVCYL